MNVSVHINIIIFEFISGASLYLIICLYLTSKKMIGTENYVFISLSDIICLSYSVSSTVIV